MKFKICLLTLCVLMLLAGCNFIKESYFYNIKSISINGVELNEIDRLAFINNFEDISFKNRPTKSEEDLYKMYGSKVCEVNLKYTNNKTKTIYLTKKRGQVEYSYYLEICSDKKYKICQISYEKYLFILKKSA